MPWRVMDPYGCVDTWAIGKSDEERLRLLDGIADLADRPLTELPGLRAVGQSPMSRWSIIGSTVVFVHVYEGIGVFDLMDLQDF